jgi:hypothetical protein
MRLRSASLWCPHLIACEDDRTTPGLLDGPLPQADKIRPDTHGPPYHHGECEDFVVCPSSLSGYQPGPHQVLHSEVRFLVGRERERVR